MRVLITGAEGFIGRNVVSHLVGLTGFTALQFNRGDSVVTLEEFVMQADAIIHLAGENRPINDSAFEVVNVGLTQTLCDLIRKSGRQIPFVFASSVHAEKKSPYGLSKLKAERIASSLSIETNNPVYIYRLPNVFGKWSKPNYNSVVATFCHNVANDIPLQINNKSALLSLTYIDDLVIEFISAIVRVDKGLHIGSVEPKYSITLGELADTISGFKFSRESLRADRVGHGLLRALYSTYVSFLAPHQFSYAIPSHSDDRGCFVEMLKTKDSGQFSFFTARPGVTRGGHYHHSKTEKFLVIKGCARFGFKNVITGEKFQLLINGDSPQVVDTVPGWAHDITNVGEGDLIVMLWANEVFDRKRPDTLEYSLA